MSASGWTYATINGRLRPRRDRAGPRIKTDPLGQITILQRVDSLAAQRLTPSSPALAAPVTLDPTDRLRESLAPYRTGADLAAARTRNGAPPPPRPIPPASTPPPAPSRRCSARAHGSRAAPRCSKRRAPPPAGASRSTAASRLLDLGRRALADVFGRPVADAIVGAAGDVIESMLDGLTRISRFVMQVVNGVLELIVDVGGKILRFVVETASQVYRVMHWVLKETLGLDLDALSTGSASPSPWPDILRTQKVITTSPAAPATTPRRASPIWRRPSTRSSSKRWRGRASSGSRRSPPSSAGGASRRGAAPEGHAAPSALLDDPSGSWAVYQFLHGGVGATQGIELPIKSPLIDAVSAFVKNVLLPVLETVGATGLRAILDLEDALRAGTLTSEQVVLHVGRRVRRRHPHRRGGDHRVFALLRGHPPRVPRDGRRGDRAARHHGPVPAGDRRRAYVGARGGSGSLSRCRRRRCTSW